MKLTRYRVMGWVLICAACTGPGEAPTTDVPGEPLPGLTDSERARFLLGRALFERLATPQEGLGPLFNAERCSDCHDSPAIGGGGVRIPVLKATRFVDGTCSLLVDGGGDNIQQRATPLLVAAGMGPEEVPSAATATARVVAPPLFGLGLMEAIPDAELARAADPDDEDGDGISGRVAYMPDGRSARFGRKGDAVTVADFVDTALRFELGFTTEDHPTEERRNGVVLPRDVDPMPDPEMDAATMRLLTDYVRLLAPPAPERLQKGPVADSVRRGETVFEQVGCAGCHTPVLTTGEAGEGALAHRIVPLYSDLLLHDLGGAASDVCTPQAAPGEYRTAPLWGLRYRRTYLHDGSATTLGDAVTRHGGEAANVIQAFGSLGEGDRAALLRFLQTL
ncbi:MAG: hypothetical protein OEZ37_01350 [Gemmatimonadota bacterium]|nr:hypothetical protein [Gemmatimonadota bacterium]